ncbi:N-acetyltransferase [Taibaiella sp. KBW10]|uniref:GNAT family N-acetyltransferase n=1 Tax=Taibaiella sp. KBW10 TaxID=2153357 RepID=UPI000F5AA528|nr:GNAT family protein [Taibaiella sp. KBW10]RQO31020.1 N-acetyltransferase [Taibaiella sp. KBW10]
MTDFLLRPWQKTDLDSLLEQANNPNIAQFMTDMFPYPYTREKGLSFIEFATLADPVHIFAIEVNGKAVGGIGIHPQTDIMRKNAELGYWLGETYWGRGIISRAIPQMIVFAFKAFDINRIFAKTFGNNIVSQSVLIKNGFLLEAHMKNTIFKNGRYIDELIYAVRRTDYERSN